MILRNSGNKKINKEMKQKLKEVFGEKWSHIIEACFQKLGLSENQKRNHLQTLISNVLKC